MQELPLPGQALSLSIVGLGLWTLSGSNWTPPTSPEDLRQTLRAAVDLGINWVDSAPLYGDGEADRRLAPLLREHPGLRVATKVGARREASGHIRADLRPEQLIADLEISLRRLRRSEVELVQAHWPCERGTPIGETMGALRSLVDRGLARAFGLCNFGVSALQEARRWAQPQTLQTPVSMLVRDLELGLSEECKTARGEAPQPVGVIAYETLCRGLLARRWSTPPTFPTEDLRSRDPRFRGPRFVQASALLADLQRVAVHLQVPLPALALGWVLRRPTLGWALVGARSPQQLQQSCAALDLLPRIRLWEGLDRLIASHPGL